MWAAHKAWACLQFFEHAAAVRSADLPALCSHDSRVLSSTAPLHSPGLAAHTFGCRIMAGKLQAIKADLKAKRRLSGWVLPKPESAVRLARPSCSRSPPVALADMLSSSSRRRRTGLTMVRASCAPSGLRRELTPTLLSPLSAAAFAVALQTWSRSHPSMLLGPRRRSPVCPSWVPALGAIEADWLPLRLQPTGSPT